MYNVFLEIAAFIFLIMALLALKDESVKIIFLVIFLVITFINIIGFMGGIK